MPVELMALPFSQQSLAPHMSEETITYHYGKHHSGYVDKLNSLIADSALADASLEDIIVQSKDDPDAAALFNNAAQIWNHDFFWHSISPEGGDLGDGPLKDQIGANFGGLSDFKDAFKATATGQFGSGWAWLVLDGDRLSIVSTPNAVPPFVNGLTPLLTCDVWEHAYYLDHRNDRAAFVQTFLDNLVNWEFAAQRFQEATG